VAVGRRSFEMSASGNAVASRQIISGFRGTWRGFLQERSGDLVETSNLARACIEIARERNSEFRATARKRSQQRAIDRMRSSDHPFARTRKLGIHDARCEPRRAADPREYREQINSPISDVTRFPAVLGVGDFRQADAILETRSSRKRFLQMSVVPRDESISRIPEAVPPPIIPRHSISGSPTATVRQRKIPRMKRDGDIEFARREK